jgi:hypothetical protein
VWTTADEKSVLVQALNGARAHLVSKIEGIDESAARRPMTPSLTNLLGIVKHVTGTELRICDTFGQPRPRFAPEDDGELWNAGDMWAKDDESAADIAAAYRAACAAADRVVTSTDLDAVGEWMSLRTTLRALLVGQIWETAQHAGHADIVRELLDGSIGGPGSRPANAANRAIQLARMRGEVGPEAWGSASAPGPELDAILARYDDYCATTFPAIRNKS